MQPKNKKKMRLYSPVDFTMGEALSREDEVTRNLAFLMNDIIKIKSLENKKKKYAQAVGLTKVFFFFLNGFPKQYAASQN